MNAGFIFGADCGLLRQDLGARSPPASSEDLKKRLFRISYRGMLDRPSINALQLASEAIARLSFDDKMKVLRGLVFLRVHTQNNQLRLPLFLGETS